ncbi:MAG: GDP-mannose 4,6-dehydratase [Betaproteobacteria bacterium]|nr:GDP-mannose 4,6-dehydratase [Betaproteobacteria bacterium]NDD11157.1 GDP-mannose 4,6-dehydratase [Betaproteobacteria bacterium]
MSRRVLITGITGQDGAYLAQHCLNAGDLVFGAFRHVASASFWRLQELGVLDHPRLQLLEFDLIDPASCLRLVRESKPEEIYNLAAQSFVGTSFTHPGMTAQITGFGVVNLLEAMRSEAPDARFYQASTSEMFGKAQTIPQNEQTSFYPRSPYGAAKVYAHWMVVNYRESYGLHCVSGILFNHESPLRGAEFVTRKITQGVAAVVKGHKSRIELGNLDARRDWGYAPEYVAGMRMIVHAPEPGSYVLASGKTHSVRDFVSLAFAAADIELEFEGSGPAEVGRDCRSGEIRVTIDKTFFRPAEVDVLVGDATRAQMDLGWSTQTDLSTLCALMVQADIRRAEQRRA